MTVKKETPQSSVFCRQCGYQLTGLSENRCPECGRAFNPTDRRTYLRHPKVWGVRLWLRRFAVSAAVGVVLAIAIFAGIVTNLYLQWRGEQKTIAAVRGVGGFVEVSSGSPTWVHKCLGYRSGPQLLDEPPSYTSGLVGTRLAFLLDRVHSVMLSGAGPWEESPHVRIFFTDPVPVDDAWIGRWIAPISALPNLRNFWLYSEQVTDIGMRRLECLPPDVMLNLCCPSISKQELDRLKRTRPNTVATLDTASQSTERRTQRRRPSNWIEVPTWARPPGWE